MDNSSKMEDGEGGVKGESQQRVSLAAWLNCLAKRPACP